MYTGFAEIYDELMKDVDYGTWADFYCRMMEGFGIRGGKLAECACGTGGLTIPLFHHGFHVTGVDLSQDMLWRAAQKAREDGLAIPFVRQDMRKLRLHRPMDAVLATCDGVNYLMDDVDLLEFFSSAYNALRPGGGLFFDVSTPHKLSKVLGNQLICEDLPNITYFWQNTWNEKSSTVTMHLCFFVKQEDGSYKRIDEEQKQKAHSLTHLSELLYQSGFARVMVFGDGRLEAPHADERRWHFAALRRVDPEQMV